MEAGAVVLKASAWWAGVAEFQAAVEKLRKAFEIYPDHVLQYANIMLANMLYATGQEEESLAFSQQAADAIHAIPAELRPAGSWGFLGRHLYRLGQFTEARQAFEQAIFGFGDSEPKLSYGPRWWYLAMTLNQLGEHELANEYFQQLASQIDENTPTLHCLAFQEASALMRE